MAIVLSLFDGIGTGYHILTNVLNFTVKKYITFENDPTCNGITRTIVPEDILVQLGDINDKKSISKLVKEYPHIDLILAAPPCCDVSSCNGRNSRLNLDGQQSGLFYNALEFLYLYPGAHFIFENVSTIDNKTWNIMTNCLTEAAYNSVDTDKDVYNNININVDDIDHSKKGKKLWVNLIDSSLFKCMKRKRWIWTSFPITPVHFNSGADVHSGIVGDNSFTKFIDAYDHESKINIDDDYDSKLDDECNYNYFNDEYKNEYKDDYNSDYEDRDEYKDDYNNEDKNDNNDSLEYYIIPKGVNSDWPMDLQRTGIENKKIISLATEWIKDHKTIKKRNLGKPIVIPCVVKSLARKGSSSELHRHCRCVYEAFVRLGRGEEWIKNPRMLTVQELLDIFGFPIDYFHDFIVNTITDIIIDAGFSDVLNNPDHKGLGFVADHDFDYESLNLSEVVKKKITKTESKLWKILFNCVCNAWDIDSLAFVLGHFVDLYC